jgi:hypothetical protein
MLERSKCLNPLTLEYKRELLSAWLATMASRMFAFFPSTVRAQKKLRQRQSEVLGVGGRFERGRSQGLGARGFDRALFTKLVGEADQCGYTCRQWRSHDYQVPGHVVLPRACATIGPWN